MFIAITVGMVAWPFLGSIVGFDQTPWPLLLTILNLPQLFIMISLQVSAKPGAGRPRQIQEAVSKILAAVSGPATA